MASITENYKSGTGDVVGAQFSRASRKFDVIMDAITEDAIADHVATFYPANAEHPKFPGLFVSEYEKTETEVPLEWKVEVIYEPITVVAHNLNEWQVTFRVNAETERLVRSIQLGNDEAQAGVSVYDGLLGPTLTKDTTTKIIGPVAWRIATSDDPMVPPANVLGKTRNILGFIDFLTVGDETTPDIEPEDLPRRRDGIDRLTSSVTAVLSRQIAWSPYPHSPGTGSGLNMRRLWEISNFKTTVNNSTFLGVDAHTLIFSNFEASQNTADIDGIQFDVLDVSLEFMYNPSAWTPVELFDAFTYESGYESPVFPGDQYLGVWPTGVRPISTWYPIYHESNHLDIFQLLGVSIPSFTT